MASTRGLDVRTPSTRRAVDPSESALDWRPTTNLENRAEAPSQHRLRSPVVVVDDSATGTVRLDTELERTARLEDPSVGKHPADDRVSPLVGDALPYVHAGQRSALRHVSGSGTKLMHSVQARGEVRPNLRPTLREIDHRANHLLRRVPHIELEAELGHADTIFDGSGSTPRLGGDEARRSLSDALLESPVSCDWSRLPLNAAPRFRADDGFIWLRPGHRGHIGDTA
jgi:hypothetical protein